MTMFFKEPLNLVLSKCYKCGHYFNEDVLHVCDIPKRKAVDTPKRKAVQIATWSGISVALANDGTIWQPRYTCGDHPKLEWFRLPDIPQDEVKND